MKTIHKLKELTGFYHEANRSLQALTYPHQPKGTLFNLVSIIIHLVLFLRWILTRQFRSKLSHTHINQTIWSEQGDDRGNHGKLWVCELVS
ncbi:hypothetical protein L1887_16685 [Cichorium endivia]|nr:hypothetical protein L1887_16685 [Cichorium endivia]